MTTVLAALLLSAQAVAPPAAAAPPLTLEQSSALKCGVAFAMAETVSVDGQAAAVSPELRTRGREFFVRAAAKIMDETGAGREAIMALVAAQSAAFRERPQEIDAAMPACLLLLDASGL